MHFTYTFKTSDGTRRRGAIDAASRDEAFAALRADGIRPIRMVTTERETVNGGKGYGKRVVAMAAVLAAVLAGLSGYLFSGRQGADAKPSPPRGVQSPLTLIDASSRHWFRLSDGADESLTAGERMLAKFARPGERISLSDEEKAQFPAAVFEAINHQTTVDEGESSETRELKGVVAGLKEEAEVYIRTGSGLSDYLVFLFERQKMEAEAREKIINENQPGEANRILSAMRLKPIDE